MWDIVWVSPQGHRSVSGQLIRLSPVIKTHFTLAANTVHNNTCSESVNSANSAALSRRATLHSGREERWRPLSSTCVHVKRDPRNVPDVIKFHSNSINISYTQLSTHLYSSQRLWQLITRLKTKAWYELSITSRTTDHWSQLVMMATLTYRPRIKNQLKSVNFWDFKNYPVVKIHYPHSTTPRSTDIISHWSSSAGTIPNAGYFVGILKLTTIMIR